MAWSLLQDLMTGVLAHNDWLKVWLVWLAWLVWLVVILVWLVWLAWQVVMLVWLVKLVNGLRRVVFHAHMQHVYTQASCSC